MFSLRSSRIFNVRILFVALIMFCIVYLLFSYDSTAIFSDDVSQCYRKPTNREISALEKQGKLSKLNDIFDGKPKPNPGRSIFFHETSCHGPVGYSKKPVPFNFVNLTSRAACAVESAALHNPNSDVFVLFASPTYWDNTAKNPTIDAIISYPNVQLRNLDLWSYAAETPLEEWFETGILFKSDFLIAHMSDCLRLLTLWHFGGTYLDTDVVVLRTLEDLPPNYAGAESNENIANGVMNFGLDKIGRKVAEYCLNDFKQNYNGRIWGTNGPGVITRNLKHFCWTNNITEMFDKERCFGFQVYKREAFYAVFYSDWSDFFEENVFETTLNKLESSFGAHIWNNISKDKKLNVSKRAVYNYLAKNNCPRVFATIKEYF